MGDTRRWRDPFLAIVTAAGFVFGLLPLLVPTQFATTTGFLGTDTFLIRLAGCATLAYGVGLAVGFRDEWRAIRIAVAGVLVFNLASLVACAAAFAQGGATWIVYVVALTSVVFVVGTALLLRDPPLKPGEPAVGSGQPDIATWLIGLFVIGTIAAFVFGIGPLVLGGAFGRQLGYSGNDDWIYRQAGAATLGIAVGGVLELLSRRWAEVRIPTLMAFTFNATAVLAALLEISGGSPQPVAYLILATGGLVAIGTAAAYARGGK